MYQKLEVGCVHLRDGDQCYSNRRPGRPGRLCKRLHMQRSTEEEKSVSDYRFRLQTPHRHFAVTVCGTIKVLYAALVCLFVVFASTQQRRMKLAFLSCRLGRVLLGNGTEWKKLSFDLSCLPFCISPHLNAKLY